MARKVAVASAACRSWCDHARGRRIVLFQKTLGVLLVCLGLFAVGNPARALLIGPGEAIEVTFDFSAPPDAGGNTVDLLYMTITPIISSGPTISVLSQLFDGATLLGGGVQSISAFTGFSDGIYGNAFPANLDSVRDGTIDGRIVLTPTFPGGTGFMEFDPANLKVGAAHAVTTERVLFASPNPTVLSVGTTVSAVPVPAALLLFASALAAVVAALFRRRLRGEAAA